MITFLTHSFTSPKKISFSQLLKLKKIYPFIFINVWLIWNCVTYVSLISFNLFKEVVEGGISLQVPVFPYYKQTDVLLKSHFGENS